VNHDDDTGDGPVWARRMVTTGAALTCASVLAEIVLGVAKVVTV
jgi:hypothetical protein